MEENRESNMVRLGCLRDAVATVDIEQRNGYFKNKDVTEDVPTRINLYFQKYLELIQQGRPAPEGFQTPQKKPAPVELSITPEPPKDDEPREATEKMKKAIWAISFGGEGNQEAQDELKQHGLTKFNVTKAFIHYDWAMEFIDRYKQS